MKISLHAISNVTIGILLLFIYTYTGRQSLLFTSGVLLGAGVVMALVDMTD